MINATRRNLLKNMAGLSVLGMATKVAEASKMIPMDDIVCGLPNPCRDAVGAAAGQARAQLNVLLHGLFVIDFREDSVHVLAPCVPNHRYRAGIWKQEQPLDEHRWYSLEGLGERKKKPALDETSYPILKQRANPELSLMKVKLRLPLPDAVHGIRCADRGEGDPPFFAQSGRYAPVAALKHLPLIFALVYHYDSSRETPYLRGAGWSAPRGFHGPLNLHIRAEMAFTCLLNAQDYLRQSLRISNAGDLLLADEYAKFIPEPDRVSPLLGVSVDEEYELFELSPSGQKTPTAVYSRNGIPTIGPLAPANCSSTINGGGSK